jgi:hypothetical protein
MTFRADFDMQIVFHGRTCLEGIAARADNCQFIIIRMNFRFHCVNGLLFVNRVENANCNNKRQSDETSRRKANLDRRNPCTATKEPKKAAGKRNAKTQRENAPQKYNAKTRRKNATRKYNAKIQRKKRNAKTQRKKHNASLSERSRTAIAENYGLPRSETARLTMRVDFYRSRSETDR